MSAKKTKSRLDQLLVDQGFAENLQLAGALVMAGEVLVAGAPAKSAGQQVFDDAPLRLKKSGDGWVSRGAHKLLTAVERFHLNLKGRVCLDVGSSTGGFTQVLLHCGASRVYSLDVGYGLLDWSLRRDNRVVVMERQNARFMTPEMFSPSPDFACTDASFISLRLLLNPMADVTADGSEAVVLVKPQFEAPSSDVGEGGIVRSPEVHAAVLKNLRKFIDAETPWSLQEASWSSIRGTKGNMEYLFHLRKNAPPCETDLDEVVRAAHEALDR
ncbi:MAG: TlyA family RNA methyltransferase [Pyramidobacter sp.]|jgi:23S rRNA (cytidine1920-2'-O)/16S rRNA (cytidine1409-2'-O)-methyltransferase